LYCVGIQAGGEGIELNLSVINTSEEADLVFAGCLHTYLAVNSPTVEVQGLSGNNYVDKCDDCKLKCQPETPWRVKDEAERSGEEAGKPHLGYVDRIYSATDEVEITDVTKEDWLLHIEQSSNWTHTTVYNPWQGDKLGGEAAGLDFDEDGYLGMLCIEPTIGNSKRKVCVKPGDTWTGTQAIQVAMSDTKPSVCTFSGTGSEPVPPVGEDKGVSDLVDAADRPPVRFELAAQSQSQEPDFGEFL